MPKSVLLRPLLSRTGNKTFSRFQVSALDPGLRTLQASACSSRSLTPQRSQRSKIVFSRSTGTLTYEWKRRPAARPIGQCSKPTISPGQDPQDRRRRGDPYAIPTSNPFRGREDVREEIWALGLRNPWRLAFDSANGDLYVADVGENFWEEITLQPGGSPGAGTTSGMSRRATMHIHMGSGVECRAAARAFLRVLPRARILHGFSISGGEVYRGCRMPDLQGRYFSRLLQPLGGEFGSRTLWPSTSSTTR